MSAAAYNGIDELMKAEEQAACIVQEARQSKSNSSSICSFSNAFVGRQVAMAEAREKAKEEIEQYRAEMEKEYEEKKTNVCCLKRFCYAIVRRCRISKGSRRT